MTDQLSGKVAAVTGAASGIGLETARLLHSEGAVVFFVDRDAARLMAATGGLGERAIPLTIDLTDPASLATMLPAILGRAKKLDIFHANAGAYVGGLAAEGDPDAWDRMLNLNVNAAFRSVHAVLGHMIENKTGDIVMTSSVAGFVPVVHEPVYTASKHAVQAFVHTLRRQVAPHGLRVGAVAPGPVFTPLLADWSPERLAREKAAGGLIEPVEVAHAVLFMLTRPRNVTVRDLVILPQAFDI